MNNRSLHKWWINNFIFLIILGMTLFLVSGDWSWRMGWGTFSIAALSFFIRAFTLDKNLMIERSRIPYGTKRWDLWLSIIIIFGGLLTVCFLSGLEHRFWGTHPILSKLQLPALICVILGDLLVTWAMVTNKFYSLTIRIQHEQNHKVVTQGPYKVIRHPGYLGGMIRVLMLPIALGSLAGIILSLFIISAYIVKTYIEDTLLQRHLRGYYNYTKTVHYRLFPWVW